MLVNVEKVFSRLLYGSVKLEAKELQQRHQTKTRNPSKKEKKKGNERYVKAVIV